MRSGCCTNLDNFDHVAQAGYDFAEMNVATVRSEEDEDAFGSVSSALTSRPIKPEAFNVWMPPALAVVGPDVDRERVRRHVWTSTRRIAALGGEVLVFGSGGARRVPEGFPGEAAHEQLLEFLALGAEAARASGLTIVVEPLCRRMTNTVNTLLEGLELVREVDRPEVRLLADLFHMTEDDEPLDDLLPAAPCLWHVHVPVPDVPILASSGRTHDHAGFLGRLRRTGYSGRISVEDNARRFRDVGREAGPVLAHLRALWDASGSGIGR